MEFWIVLGIVLVAASWLVVRTVRKFRATLRAQGRCERDWTCPPAQRGHRLQPPDALLRKDRRPPSDRQQ